MIGYLKTIMSTPFIPSLKQIAEAADKLPIPDLWPEGSYLIPIANSSVKQELKFKKLAFKDSNDNLCYHWVYEGQVTVETSITP